MAIVRWEPFGRNILPWQGFDVLRSRMDRLFDEFSREDTGEVVQSKWLPSVDIREDQDQYFIQAEIPGMTRKDIKITLEGTALTISGEKKFERENKENKYHLTERVYGNFSRTFNLPSKVNAKEIKANHSDGVLQISIPKAAEVRPREIEISIK